MKKQEMSVNKEIFISKTVLFVNNYNFRVQ